MVGAGSMVRTDAAADLFQVAPSDDGVDQAVAAAVLEVGLAEAQPEEVVGVVRQREVQREELAADGPRGGGVRFQNDGLLGTEFRTSPQNGAGLRGVLG